MSIRSSFPTDSPSLVLDFANSRRLDPRITFTRAQTGNISSYMGPDGLIKYAGPDQPRFDHKLNPRTNLFNNATSPDTLNGWLKGPGTTRHGLTAAPDGTNTAVIYSGDGIPGGDFVAQAKNLLANTTYTVSVYARLVSGAAPTAGTIIGADYNNGTGPVRSTVAMNGNLTSEWKRFSTTFTNVTAVSGYGMYFVADPNNTAQIAIWGAKMEIGSSATSFSPDDEVDKIESLGLLIEESRSNIHQSNHTQLRGSGTGNGERFHWDATSSDVIAPDGTNSTFKAYVDGTEINPGGSLYIINAINTTYTSTNIHTSSVFIKPALETKFRFTAHDQYASATNGGVADNITFEFDLSTPQGSVTLIESGGISATVTPYPNGWYRCSWTYYRNSANPRNSLYAVIIYPLTWQNANTGVGTICYVWGPQVEQGAFPTSYIPTNGSAVTRNDENVILGGSGFTSFYNQDEGTMVCEAELIKNLRGLSSTFDRFYQVTNDLFSIGAPTAYLDPTNDNVYFRYRIDDSNSQAVVLDNYFINQSPPPDLTKFAIAYQDANYAVCGNGENVVRDTDGIHIKDSTRLMIGRQPNNLLAQLNGIMKKLSYYPIRLSNAQLQELTK